MIFVAATDDRTLTVFAAAEEAVAHCEGVDVEDGSWLFWDEVGMALAPEFLASNHRGRLAVGSGTYHLIPAPHLPSLTQTLATLHAIEANPHFATLAALRAHLATVATVRQHGA